MKIIPIKKKVFLYEIESIHKLFPNFSISNTPCKSTVSEDCIESKTSTKIREDQSSKNDMDEGILQFWS